MNMTLLLPWFPIVLAVGVAGRVLGRARGMGMGFLCALFWLALVQASAGSGMWSEPWTVVASLSGSVAIVAMGGWAGQMSPGASRGPVFSADSYEPAVASAPNGDSLARFSAMIDRFDEWLDGHRDHPNPWPEFGEFIRNVLCHSCSATHVQPYRLRAEGDELVALHEPDVFTEAERLPARQGIVGHVVTTGRAYLAGDSAQGELVQSLAVEWKKPLAWCFPIQDGKQRVGAVVVGKLSLAPNRHRELLHAAEQLIGLFWNLLSNAVNTRSALEHDPVSGLFTRPMFLKTAEQSLRQSYRLGEPVAVAVVAVEGTRELGDSGRWETADELVSEVSRSLRQKVRSDDRLGRFDGSRFVLLLRRVDSELASLIIGQLMSRLGSVCGDASRWGVALRVRCGVVGSGTEQPDLRTLVSKAMLQCRRARMEDIPIANDLTPLPPNSTRAVRSTVASPVLTT